MEIVSTKCWANLVPSGRYHDCLAFFGLEYQIWLVLIVLSVMLGFGAYSFYGFIRKTAFKPKEFLFRSAAISIAFLVVLYLTYSWFISQIRY